MSEPAVSPGARRTLAWGAAGGAAVVALAVAGIGTVWPAGPTAGYLAGVAAVFGLYLVVLRQSIHGAGREAGAEGLTLATRVTILRAGAAAVLAGFLLSEPTRPGIEAWLPAALFAVAAGLDAIDGRIARLRGSVTELGGRLDVEIDALAMLVGTALAVAAGSAPVAYLSVGLARYAFVAGLGWRERRGKPVDALPESRLRPVLGAAAMIATWIALLPAVGQEASKLVTTVVMIPFLLNFGRDYLVVTGRI